MSAVTENVKAYIKEKGISITNLAAKTGHSYQALSVSIGNPKTRNVPRDLRDDEFLDICMFLDVDPRMFAVKKDEE